MKGKKLVVGGKINEGDSEEVMLEKGEELQESLDNDEEYESRKGIASAFQKMFRKKKA